MTVGYTQRAPTYPFCCACTGPARRTHDADAHAPRPPSLAGPGATHDPVRAGPGAALLHDLGPLISARPPLRPAPGPRPGPDSDRLRSPSWHVPRKAGPGPRPAPTRTPTHRPHTAPQPVRMLLPGLRVERHPRPTRLGRASDQRSALASLPLSSATQPASEQKKWSHSIYYYIL